MKPVIIIAIAFVLLIPIPVFAITDVEKIMSDYKLKGDAYDEFGYSYIMPFMETLEILSQKMCNC